MRLYSYVPSNKKRLLTIYATVANNRPVLMQDYFKDASSTLAWLCLNYARKLIAVLFFKKINFCFLVIRSTIKLGSSRNPTRTIHHHTRNSYNITKLTMVPSCVRVTILACLPRVLWDTLPGQCGLCADDRGVMAQETAMSDLTLIVSDIKSFLTIVRCVRLWPFPG